MSFRKLTALGTTANTDRNVSVRQRWAMTYLEQWAAGLTFINIDESWLSTTDFRRMAWGSAQQRPRLPIKNVWPRITVLAAESSRGDVYYALSQEHTNSETFCLFI